MKRYLIHILVRPDWHPAVLDTPAMQGVKVWLIDFGVRKRQLFVDLPDNVAIGDIIALLGFVGLPSGGATEFPFSDDAPSTG